MRIILAASPICGLTPAEWTTARTFPPAADLLEEAGDGLAVGDVADEGARFDAILGQCGRSRVKTRLIEIGQNDAVVGAEEPRGGEPHAACAAGDDRGLRHGRTPLQA